jgi:WD40 repeat protein
VNSIQPGHFDLVLCAIVINNKYLVTGGKDSQLIVTTLQGEKIASLRGHESSICTLALIEDKGVIYLASGSDHGCNSIIIWDTSSWSIKAKIKAHTAAVTSIVDLCDGQTLVSGSYDKKINVYNYKRSALLFSLPNNKSSVTSMLLNSSRNKLISCGFDSMMFVWNISRDQTGVVEAISIDRVIQNNSIICCLSGSMLRP